LADLGDHAPISGKPETGENAPNPTSSRPLGSKAGSIACRQPIQGGARRVTNFLNDHGKKDTPRRQSMAPGRIDIMGKGAFFSASPECNRNRA
jgi:hypothetical protein